MVIFAREDRDLASKLVDALRASELSTWWSEEINHGEWDVQVQHQIKGCIALVPLVTRHTADKAVFKREWKLATLKEKAIFPFVVDELGLPLEVGLVNQTDASSWSGDAQDAQFRSLLAKIMRHMTQSEDDYAPRGTRSPDGRPRSLKLGEKSLALPEFVFSLSTFETQLDPLDGLELLAGFQPGACLVSAFDVHADSRAYRDHIERLTSSRSVMFLDSGNYEASRINRYVKGRRQIWSKSNFWSVASSYAWDVVFAFDDPRPSGAVNSIGDRILDAYFHDMCRTGLPSSVLCPIVHVSPESTNRADDASTLCHWISSEVRPRLIAIPERELGSGILERMQTVKSIRAKLNQLGHYQPLHVLGTGNPITMAALAVCGADTFDGLEWCRTAANFETNNLMHFHQFDVLAESFGGRVSNENARAIVELHDAPFAIRAASYNFDYFTYWAKYLQACVHAQEPQNLLFNQIPYLGSSLSRRYLNEQ